MAYCVGQVIRPVLRSINVSLTLKENPVFLLRGAKRKEEKAAEKEGGIEENSAMDKN